jgi:hypothetical protein
MALRRCPLWCALALCLAIWLGSGSRTVRSIDTFRSDASRSLSLQIEAAAGEFRSIASKNARLNPLSVFGDNRSRFVNRGAS